MHRAHEGLLDRYAEHIAQFRARQPEGAVPRDSMSITLLELIRYTTGNLQKKVEQNLSPHCAQSEVLKAGGNMKGQRQHGGFLFWAIVLFAGVPLALTVLFFGGWGLVAWLNAKDIAERPAREAEATKTAAEKSFAIIKVAAGLLEKRYRQSGVHAFSWAEVGFNTKLAYPYGHIQLGNDTSVITMKFGHIGSEFLDGSWQPAKLGQLDGRQLQYVPQVKDRVIVGWTCASPNLPLEYWPKGCNQKPGI